MAAIAEFYSANLSTEVTKGLRTKATTGKAPIGYRNIRVQTEAGHELRTVELDPNRAPLIQFAFEAYATGEWTLNTLLDELTVRGLTSAPTPKRPAKPIHVSTLHRTLQNPYYKGVIVYDGLEYDADHQPLVTVEIWERVQSVLRANNLAGDKTQTHDHYLKGSLYCDDCDSRLLLTHAKNKQGVIYPYFICAGRHAKLTDCRRKAMHVDRVEQLVIDHYARVQLDPTTRDALQASISEEFAILNAHAKHETDDLARQKNDLLDQRDKLMQAHYAGAVPLDQLKTEQQRITGQVDHITARLDQATADYAEAQAELADCLDLLGDCHTVYQQAPDPVRRLFNQALFDKIYITSTDTVRTEKTGPFAILLNQETQRSTRRDLQAREQTDVQTPSTIQMDECLNIKRWVELRGFEPLTSSMPWKRATNCAIAPRCRAAPTSVDDPGGLSQLGRVVICAAPHARPGRRRCRPRRQPVAPTLCCARRHAGRPERAACSTDQWQFPTPVTPFHSPASSPSSALIPAPIAAPCVTTTRVSSSSSAAACSTTAAATRAPTSPRGSSPTPSGWPLPFHTRNSSGQPASICSRSSPSQTPNDRSRSRLSSTAVRPVRSTSACAVRAARTRSEDTIAVGRERTSTSAARAACSTPVGSSSTSDWPCSRRTRFHSVWP